MALQQHSTAEQQLGDLMKREIGAVTRLLQSLDREYAALAEQQPDALEQVVQNKQLEISQLERITKQREQLMQRMNLHADAGTDSQKLFNNNGYLASLWRQLASLAEQCRHKNRINGGVVDAMARQSQQALQVLRGVAPEYASASGLYDQSGRTANASVKRSLTQV